MAGQPQAGQVARAPRVLLVDDNPAMRRVLRGLLEDTGMQVVAEAADGLEGVTQAEAAQPVVVLMDWRMPTWTVSRPLPASANGSLKSKS